MATQVLVADAITHPRPKRTGLLIVHIRFPLLLIVHIRFPLLLIALLALPSLTSMNDSVDIGDTISVELPLDEGGTARVPESWTYRQSPGGEHAVLGLGASTNHDVTASSVEVTTDSLSITWLQPKQMTTRDAFVQVHGIYMLMMDRPKLPPIPRDFELDDAASEVTADGTTYSWQGLGKDRGIVTVTTFIGADAGERTRAEAEYILDHLKIGH